MERIDYILSELDKRKPELKTQVVEYLMELCNCPEEAIIIAHFLGQKAGRNQVCNNCPIGEIFKDRD